MWPIFVKIFVTTYCVQPLWPTFHTNLDQQLCPTVVNNHFEWPLWTTIVNRLWTNIIKMSWELLQATVVNNLNFDIDGWTHGWTHKGSYEKSDWLLCWFFYSSHMYHPYTFSIGSHYWYCDTSWANTKVKLHWSVLQSEMIRVNIQNFCFITIFCPEKCCLDRMFGWKNLWSKIFFGMYHPRKSTKEHKKRGREYKSYKNV